MTSGTGPPVQIANFYSSFDTGAVLDKLRAAREVPLQQLDTQQAQVAQRQTAMTMLTTQFSSLLSRVNTLFDKTSVSAKTASVSGLGVSAAAGPTATPGSFTVDVTQIATGTKLTGSVLSAAVDSASMLASSNFGMAVTAGTFTVKTSSGTATITVDPTTQSLQDVIDAINLQTGTTGVTASLVNDSNGRPNILHLASTSGNIQLGSGADTSNFLAATNLLASPGTTTRDSTMQIARVNLAAKLNVASLLGGAPASGAHSFTINGTTINYDSSADSLADIVSRINSSTAGVTAAYDPVTDTVSLNQTKLGSIEMTLADDGSGGDLLAKLGLVGATQSLGTNAQYSINGGATQYSNSNTITPVTGVTVTLTAPTGGVPATVNVGQDSSSALSSVQDFVTDFNSLYSTLASLTKSDKDSPGVFAGDSSLQILQAQMRSIVTGTAFNGTGRYTDLGAIGLSFGAVGSAVGTTNTLVFDQDKFNAAMQADPASVQNAFSGLTLSASLQSGGTGSVTAIAGNYLGSKAGTYAVTDDGAGNLTAIFTPKDGSAPVTTVGSIAANGTNTTLIPGITLTAGALQAGVFNVDVTQSSASVLSLLRDYLNGQVGPNGTLTKRQDEFTAVSKDIDARRTRMQAAIDAEMALWEKKFTAMEQAQAQAQSISQALTQAFAKSTTGN